MVTLKIFVSYAFVYIMYFWYFQNKSSVAERYNLTISI